MKLIIEEFKTEALLKEFISWYENDGEQYFAEWLKYRDHLTRKEKNHAANVAVDDPNWKYQDEHGNWVMKVR